jgi:CSLREA domain-containing protein
MKNQKKLYVTYFVMIFALILTTVSTAQAATFTVNSAVDSHDTNPGDGYCDSAYAICSLRAAIEEANALPGSDFILFSNSFKAPNAPKTIVLKHGQLEIKSDLTINGPGARQLMIDADGKSRVLSVEPPQGVEKVTVLIAFLTIQNGYLYNPDITVTGAGIINKGNLVLSRVTVRNNVAMRDFNKSLSASHGGGIANYRFLNLESSTVSGNKGSWGGGIYNFGDLYTYNSTISDNEAFWGGSGIYNFNVLGEEIKDEIWIINTTIANNFTPGAGGGISNPFNFALHMANTIVANNLAQLNNDMHGSFNSAGNNLVRDRGSSTGYVASDLPDGTDPKLGALKNNGGPTDTRALISGSPAINEGNNCFVPVPDCSGDLGNDQRGHGFPRKFGRIVDIGAFEFQGEVTIAQIRGKVLKPNGRGLNNALVTLTSSDGELRSVETDQHGNFSFEDVRTSERYIIKVESRHYDYAPQDLFVSEDPDDVIFVSARAAEPPDTE